MTRLVIFTLFVTAVVSLMFLEKNKSLPVSSKRFDMKTLEKEKSDKDNYLAMIEEMKNKKPVVEKVVEEKKPEFAVDTPEAELGMKVYQKKCISCHGKYGQGKKSQKAPKIAGQERGYLEAQILAIQSGTRVNKTMMNQIKNLSKEEIAAVSTLLANYPWKF